jgi:hypothetical protein
VRLGVDQPLGYDVDPVFGILFAASGAIVAIEDPAASGRNQREVDAVAFGKKRVFVVLGHGEIQAIRPASSMPTAGLQPPQ